ncbi:hypothetical protein [Patulibacter sp. SYSU D01012]|uniref:hypothetical protein n=1 Tax=Patulibacter sp. SYSU D01012 TaxID=2817381 RepID=UPI001B30CC41|nr:hypothetical protein [Patulibacter sp. SYSU D01012]
MTRHAGTMPDFVEALETQLRGLAAAPTASAADAAAPDVAPAATPAARASVARRSGRARGWGRPARRRLALGFAVAVVAGTAGVVVPGLGGDTEPAYGRPRILEAPIVDATRALERGMSVRTVLGAGARLDRARAVPVPGGDAYLVGGDRGWCLSVPDAAAPDPKASRGVTCVRADEFDRVGISGMLGQLLVAAIPQGVPAPTLQRRSGAVVPLHPSRYGVVVVRVPRGGSVTLYATDGTTRRLEGLVGTPRQAQPDPKP